MNLSFCRIIFGHFVTLDVSPIVHAERIANDDGPPDAPICAECGQSVAPGSGKFVNRVCIFDEYAARVELGFPFPAGAYVCAECDAADGDAAVRERGLPVANVVSRQG